jgi:hypothetical protein
MMFIESFKARAGHGCRCVIPALGRLRQKDEASLGYIARSCLRRPRT